MQHIIEAHIKNLNINDLFRLASISNKINLYYFFCHLIAARAQCEHDHVNANILRHTVCQLNKQVVKLYAYAKREKEAFKGDKLYIKHSKNKLRNEKSR